MLTSFLTSACADSAWLTQWSLPLCGIVCVCYCVVWPGQQPVLCKELDGPVASMDCPTNTFQSWTFSSSEMIYCQVKRSCHYSELCQRFWHVSDFLCDTFDTSDRLIKFSHRIQTRKCRSYCFIDIQGCPLHYMFSISKLFPFFYWFCVELFLMITELYADENVVIISSSSSL